jgi:hypothetical protein
MIKPFKTVHEGSKKPRTMTPLRSLKDEEIAKKHGLL